MKIGNYHYLIIDDDTFTCEVIKHLLQKNGATRVSVAENGERAIGQIKAAIAFPDIVICDLNMPDMNGVEFVEYLAQESFTGGVVLISGTEQVILNAVARLGKAHFITILGTLSKPFDPEALLTCLASYKNDRKASAP